MTFDRPHPERAHVFCEIHTPNHPLCTGWDAVIDNYVDWTNTEHVPSKRVRGSKPVERLKVMAGRVASAPRVLDGFPAGEQGSERAASSWTDEQRQAVDDAIREVARTHAGGKEFTSDAIWAHLDGTVPVTKGLTARLMAASRLGLIDSTGKTSISERGGHHDHGQRLSVWYSLIPMP